MQEAPAIIALAYVYFNNVFINFILKRLLGLRF
jgi:hypothetical protein